MKKLTVIILALAFQISALFCVTMDARVRTVPKEGLTLVVKQTNLKII